MEDPVQAPKEQSGSVGEAKPKPRHVSSPLKRPKKAKDTYRKESRPVERIDA